MAPQMKEGLREAAKEAGCSLNSFIVQVLGAAAGDTVRFRAAAVNAEPTASERSQQLRALERDRRGYPLDWKERIQHSGARQTFALTMSDELPPGESHRFLARMDAEDPAFYVEWHELTMKSPPAALEFVRLRVAG